MPMAIKVEEGNIADIVAFGRMVEMNLEHLKDNCEYNAEEYGEETYLIFDCNGFETTFVDKSATDFRNTWKFIGKEVPNKFRPIGRV